MKLPAYCPNPACDFHIPVAFSEPVTFWRVIGHYHSKVSGTVIRFRCRRCGKGFSERTLSIDYYQKKKLDLAEIHRAASEGESVSAIARKLSCSGESVQNRIDRIARNAIAFHERLQSSISLSENLVADGFESFDQSQYFPNNINILVGQESQHLYGVTHTTLKRKGRMKAAQKGRRKMLERFWEVPRRGVETSFTSLLRCIGPLWDQKKLPVLTLITDLESRYPKAVRNIAELRTALGEGKLVHERYSSKMARTVHNPLFPVNYWERELRKDIPAYHRESVCFVRNVENGLSRFYNYLLWHNYGKPYRMLHSNTCLGCHAQYAGMEESLIGYWMERVLVDRMFPSQQRLTAEEVKTWLRSHETPLKRRPEYLQKFMRIGLLQASGN